MNYLVAFTLLEATITLYPADDAGQPILSNPLWSGANAERVSIRDRWIKVETRPTGAPYPQRRALTPQYEIGIERVWALPINQLAGFQPGRGKYVLDIVWEDEENEYWHRNTFYGVTISERGRDSREIDTGHTEHQAFDAEYMTPPTTGRDAPPAITNVLPMAVWYVSATENLELYTYSGMTRSFTEASAGVSAGRATLIYTPDATGSFAIQFDGYPKPALTIDTGGIVRVGKLVAGAPAPGETPRLEFMVGPTRVGALTARQTWYAPQFVEEAPVDSASVFEFLANSLLQVTVAAGKTSSRNGFDMASLLVDLQAHWELEEASGTRVDAHGANDLTPTAGTPPGNGTGKVGQGLSVSGGPGLARAESADGPLSVAGGPFTVSGWINFTGTPSAGVQNMIWSDGSTVFAPPFSFSVVSASLLLTDTGKLRFAVWSGQRDGGGTPIYTTLLTAGAVSAGWHFVAAWAEAGTAGPVMRLQMDDGAVLEAALPDWAAVQPTATAFGVSIGTVGLSAGGFIGVLDEMSFWKRALTQGERDLIWNGGAGLAYPWQ